MNKGLRGWEGVFENQGKYIPVDVALDYAMDKVGVVQFNDDAPDADEFKKHLVDWFFSGNWVAKYEY